MTDLASTADWLRSHPLADHGLLKPGGRREIEEALAKWRARDRHARVVVLARGAPLAPWRGLWDELRLDPERDLLLLFNGREWTARGWGLPPDRIAALLDAAEPALRTYYARGIVAALDALGEASRPPAAGNGGGGWTVGGWALGGAMAAGLVALVIRRRRAVAGAEAARFRQSLDAARDAFSRVMLAAEDLPADATELQVEAGRLGDEIDRIARAAEDDRAARRKATVRGRLDQLADELAGLHARILRRKKG